MILLCLLSLGLLAAVIAVKGQARLRRRGNSTGAGSEGVQGWHGVTVLSVATGVPPYTVNQQRALQVAMECTRSDEKVKSRLPKVYPNSMIETRHFGIPDFTPELALPGDEMLFENKDFTKPVEERLEKFHQIASPLARRVCEEALARAGVRASEVRKLVLVSSTGFLAPGLDSDLIHGVGLSKEVDCTQVLYMGCAGGCSGLRVAADYAKAHPGEVALLCAIDLSSPHTTFDDSLNNAILHAIFADGCAAAVLRSQEPSSIPLGLPVIGQQFSCLTENTEDGITLGTTANGITCTLSKNLSKYLEGNVNKFVGSVLGRQGQVAADVDIWAVHPGGRKILEAVEASIGLSREETAVSWEVLRNYGNMLGPSVLFVLEKIMKRRAAEVEAANGVAKPKSGIAFSFAPGVRVEGFTFYM